MREIESETQRIFETERGKQTESERDRDTLLEYDRERESRWLLSILLLFLLKYI